MFARCLFDRVNGVLLHLSATTETLLEFVYNTRTLAELTVDQSRETNTFHSRNTL